MYIIFFSYDIVGSIVGQAFYLCKLTNMVLSPKIIYESTAQY